MKWDHLCTGDVFTEEQNELIESSAEMLYGLIHARYILTSKGLAAMVICLLILWMTSRYVVLSYLSVILNCPAFICRSWKSSRTMTLVDAPECTAVVSPAFQQDNQIFLDRAQWKYIVRNVKNFTIQDPSTKAVSFWPILSLFWYDISIIPFTSAEWRVALLCCSFQVIYILTTF